MPSAAVEPQTFVLPASYAQQRLWFLDRIESGNGVYNVPLTTRMRGALDADALQRALDALIERHESLRTHFTLREGVPHQVIEPAQPFTLPRTDLSHQPDAETQALELVSEQASERFDLAAGPLLRVRLIKLGADDHILALTLHHAITDGWSMGVLSRDLTALYEAFAQGRTPQLPELAIQYVDYAVWQQEWIDSGGLAEQLDYWKSKLAGAPKQIELPTDKPRPRQQSFRGATVERIFPAQLLSRLREIGEPAGATPFMTLLSVVAVLLSRYSAQPDLVIATPVANRSRIELESLIGLLVNTLPLRVDLGDDPSFVELLTRVRETALEAFANQDVPFEQLVHELKPERDPSHAPIAQVLFVYQNAIERPLQLPGLHHERIVLDRQTAKFDLALFASEVRGGALRIAVEYCTDLFEPATVERLLDHLGTLLQAAVASPTVPVGRLELVDGHERARLLEQFGLSAPAYDQSPLAHEGVARQARLRPAAVAIEHADRRLTYAELEQQAGRLAAQLRNAGVGADVVVPIMARRSIEMAVAVLAVLKAGGAYAPVDPDYPPDRVAFMLGDLDAPVLVTQRRLIDALPPTGARIICLDEPAEPLGPGQDAPEPAADAGPAASDRQAERLAYVLYTSGSTGRPKGVAMGHGPLANLIAWQLESVPAPARTLQFASLSFDVAFQEIFGTWCSGGTLVLVDETTRRDPDALARYISRHQVQRLFVPFVALESLCAAVARRGGTLEHLREVITAGEQLKLTAPVRRFFDRHPGCRLFNHYGPTETHVVTSFALSGPVQAWPTLPPIGRPIPGARIYLLDGERQPVPVGVAGELYVGGISLARGYLHQAALTAERFVPDPFRPSDPSARMYRTGDLARYRADGEIQFLGRADDQVKLRGFRVELGEVEASLTQHADVGEAVVLLRDDGADGRRLIAYFVAANGTVPDDGALRDHLRRRLPEYMVPRRFVALPALPLTPTGKVNRRSLPAPNAAPDTAPLAGPSNELERALLAIWQRLLRIQRIGVDEDFFDLGGHSLLAVQVAHAIEHELRRTCTLPMLFRNRTIRSLAAELRTGGADNTEPSVLQLADGTGPALFCLCGIHAYQELAEELAADASLHGIFLPAEQEIFARGKRRAKLSVEDMAARYVRALREQQPHGPYLLLGFCFGGVLAYESAQQLRRAGEEVSLLVMLDAKLLSILGPRRRASPRRWLRRQAFNHVSRLPAFAQRSLLGEDWQSETKRLERMRLRIYGDAMRRYRVSRYDGPAVLVRPEVSASAMQARFEDPTWGWGNHIEQLTVVNVTGDHLSHLRRPHVQLMSRGLMPHLRQAVAATAAGQSSNGTVRQSPGRGRHRGELT